MLAFEGGKVISAGLCVVGDVGRGKICGLAMCCLFSSTLGGLAAVLDCWCCSTRGWAPCSTLGDGVGVVVMSGGRDCHGGMGSTRFTVVASSNRAALMGSPVDKVGTVVGGGCKRIWMMSSAACLR